MSSVIETEQVGPNTYGLGRTEESTERVYRATVFGPAGTQGSKRAVITKSGKAVIIEDSDENRHTWRQGLIREMLNNRPDVPFDCPVKITVWVFVPRPKRHYNKRHELKPNAPVLPESGRDLDKVSRAVGDAAQYGEWVVNDARVAWLEARRFYTEPGEPERTVVMMEWQGMTIKGDHRPYKPDFEIDKHPLFDYDGATEED